MVTLPFSMRTMAHDLIVTENHLILIAPPFFVDAFSMLIKGKALSECMEWKPHLGTEIIIVPIDQPHRAKRIMTEAFLPVHFFNAFEKDGKIIFDGIFYPDASSVKRVDEMARGKLAHAYPGQVLRKSIHLETEEISTESMFNEFCEFPQVSPLLTGREHHIGYGVTYSTPEAVNVDFFDSLAKLNFDTKKIEKLQLGVGHYPSEPLFVPKENGTSEDDGYLLSLVFDAYQGTNYLAIIDASQFEKGVIGKAYLNSDFPLTFHGTWVSHRS
jgi:all-trans-8'-apo-beta-carotenal 15,15'-oxygenase